MIHPRVVLDTNCLLQILGAKSKYHFLVDLFLANEYTLCLSTEIIFEYEEILRRKASPIAAELFLKIIARSRNVLRRDPYFHLNLVTKDVDDNKFVDCAFVCQADYIVTDDNHFQEVAESPFLQFRVLGLDDFARKMKALD